MDLGQDSAALRGKPYVSPRVESIGALNELTLGTGSNGTDTFGFAEAVDGEPGNYFPS
jgi:hypothetical protein